MEYNKRYRLGRGLRACYDKDLYQMKLKEGENEITKQLLSRPSFFSRCSNYDDYSIVERLFMVNEDTFIVASTKNVNDCQPTVYGYNDKFVAEALGSENNHTEYMDHVVNACKKINAAEQLIGTAFTALSDPEFDNGDYVDIVVVDGNKEYTTVNTDYFFGGEYTYHTLDLDENGELVTHELGHDHVLYRSTNNYRNAYPFIPRGSFFICTSSKTGAALLYDGGERNSEKQLIQEAKSIDELLHGENKQRMAVNASKYAKVPLVNPETCEIYTVCVPNTNQ